MRLAVRKLSWLDALLAIHRFNLLLAVLADVMSFAPLAGRKRGRNAEQGLPYPVSIRAPRAGRKDASPDDASPVMEFQSAPRERGERAEERRAMEAEKVSIRAPRAGRKSGRQSCNVSSLRFQSAPRERGERTSFTIPRSDDSGFNPRPASGAKAVALSSISEAVRCFNPRPASGAKGTLEPINKRLVRVSIRAPRAGRKPEVLTSCQERRCFNPRPASGAKARGAHIMPGTPLFQSAPRDRGERLRSVGAQVVQHVSIRAPRAGRKAPTEN